MAWGRGKSTWPRDRRGVCSRAVQVQPPGPAGGDQGPGGTPEVRPMPPSAMFARASLRRWVAGPPCAPCAFLPCPSPLAHRKRRDPVPRPSRASRPWSAPLGGSRKQRSPVIPCKAVSPGQVTLSGGESKKGDSHGSDVELRPRARYSDPVRMLPTSQAPGLLPRNASGTWPVRCWYVFMMAAMAASAFSPSSARTATVPPLPPPVILAP